MAVAGAVFWLICGDFVAAGVEDVDEGAGCAGFEGLGVDVAGCFVWRWAGGDCRLCGRYLRRSC